MPDRAAIFAEVTRRNDVRRQACLPLLGVRSEFERAVAVAIDQEVRALAEVQEHAAVLARIQREVEVEQFEEHGVRGDNWGGRYVIGRLTGLRQMAYLRAVYGREAVPVPPRHPVRYGGGRSAV